MSLETRATPPGRVSHPGTLKNGQPPEGPRGPGKTPRADWRLPAALSIILSILAAASVSLLIGGGETKTTVVQNGGGEATAAPVDPKTYANVKFEPYKSVDPTLPAVSSAAHKTFKVDVAEHVTKVADNLPPTKVWSYWINGKKYPGTGASTPMVVNQGDKVTIKLNNGAGTSMKVAFPHSIDYHSSEIAPNKAFKSIAPGETHEFTFNADHPGVFMYHCATDPVLMHTGAGMVGMMIVKPKNLAPVDKELWITQQEFYIGKPGLDADFVKMQKKQPDVIAFNGYGAQYKSNPITVKKGEKIRMFVMNAGPSIWSGFHVIGTVFDKTVVEGVVGHDAQTINLAPSQGGYVEFTLDQEGNYPFVTHAFGDMVKGAVGVLRTENAPKGAAH